MNVLNPLMFMGTYPQAPVEEPRSTGKIDDPTWADIEARDQLIQQLVWHARFDLVEHHQGDDASCGCGAKWVGPENETHKTDCTLARAVHITRKS